MAAHALSYSGAVLSWQGAVLANVLRRVLGSYLMMLSMLAFSSLTACKCQRTEMIIMMVFVCFVVSNQHRVLVPAGMLSPAHFPHGATRVLSDGWSFVCALLHFDGHHAVLRLMRHPDFCQVSRQPGINRCSIAACAWRLVGGHLCPCACRTPMMAMLGLLLLSLASMPTPKLLLHSTLCFGRA